MLIGSGLCAEIALRDIQQANGTAVCLFPRDYQLPRGLGNPQEACTIHFDPGEHDDARDLLNNLDKCGRIFLAGIVPAGTSFVAPLDSTKWTFGHEATGAVGRRALEDLCSRLNFTLGDLHEAVCESGMAASLLESKALSNLPNTQQAYDALKLALGNPPDHTHKEIRTNLSIRERRSAITLTQTPSERTACALVCRAHDPQHQIPRPFDTGFLDSVIVAEILGDTVENLLVDSGLILLDIAEIRTVLKDRNAALYLIDES